jgi:hypothetical protein
MRGLAAAIVTVVAGIVWTAGAAGASAHTTSTQFHTKVTAVRPAVPGVLVSATDNGSYMQVTTTGPVVVVYGYEQEPYLRITSGAVEENTLSPATYLNESLQIGSVPSDVDPKAPPRWKRVAAGGSFRWHDHRVHWMDAALPPVVQTDPHSAHLVSSWTIHLTAADRLVTVDGTLSWTPRPASSSTLAEAVGGVAGVVLLGGGGGLILARRRRSNYGSTVPSETPTETPSESVA